MKSMKIKIYDVFLWIFSVLMIIGVFFLPDTIPVHWNIQWEVDGFGSRYLFLVFALLPIIIYYGMLITKKIDPQKVKIEKRGKTYDLMRRILSIFFILLYVFFYCLILYPDTKLQNLLFLIFGFLFIATGNYFPKMPQNFFLGVKTAWTLSDEYVWKKTHQFAGYVFVFGGIIIFIIGLLNPPYAFVYFFGSIIICSLFPIIYSYIIYRKRG